MSDWSYIIISLMMIFVGVMVICCALNFFERCRKQKGLATREYIIDDVTKKLIALTQDHQKQYFDDVKQLYENIMKPFLEENHCGRKDSKERKQAVDVERERRID